VIDGFLGTHRRIEHRSHHRCHIPRGLFGKARQLAAERIPHPDISPLGNRRSISLIAAFYEFQLGLVKLPFTHFPYRHIYHVVILHKWSLEAEKDNSEQGRSRQSTLGAMIQRHLTLLLCDMNFRCWEDLYNFGRATGMNRHVWGRGLAGANTAAYAAMTLSMRPNATVLLSSLYEDVDLGIDLFWLEGDHDIALSVKTDTGKSSIRFSWLQSGLSRKDYDDTPDDLKKVSRGARQLSEEHRQTRSLRVFEPVLVQVGKRYGYPVPLDIAFSLQAWPQQLLDTLDGSENTRGLRCTGS
jgi:hypothetical protein